jgi:hypothetical protein
LAEHLGLSDLFFRVGQFVVFCALVFAGYVRWISPRRDSLGFQARGLLTLILFTLVGGFFGAFFWWADEPGSFSWDLPPLAGRMLASAGWAFAVACFLALERPSHQRLRLVLWLLFTYLSPIGLVAIAFHLYRFDFSAFITYAFFTVVIGMIVASTWYLVVPPHDFEDTPADLRPASGLCRTWLGALSLITVLWGFCLFATDLGTGKPIWVWPGDLLTSRLISVMLLTISVGGATALRYRDTARMMLITTATYGVGVVVAGLWNHFAGKPLPILYIGAFALAFLVSVSMLFFERSDDHADSGAR